MPTPSPAILHLLEPFAVAFTVPTFADALIVLYGAILTPGRRTVAACLRAVGLESERHFTTYHRVLNRAVWSPRTQPHPAAAALCGPPAERGCPSRAHG